MVRRHPHVFGDKAAFEAAHLSEAQIQHIKSLRTSQQVLDLWDQIKLSEKPTETRGLLDGVPSSLPALMQAQDISRKAVSVGFEWPDVESVWDQVFLEIDEYRAEGTGTVAAAQEFGDILFSLVNVARKEGIDAESALRLTCRKFRERWAIMESNTQKEGKLVSAYSLEELESLWQAAKEELVK
jgi:tetrapyrrole methylase family protein/MazG family protein